MMEERARAVYFTAPRRIEVREETLHPKSGHVLVRSEVIGISHGTEMLFFRNEVAAGMEADSTLDALAGSSRYPVKYGYTNAGFDESGGKVFAFYPHQDLFYAACNDLIALPADMELEDAVFLANMETAATIVQDAAPVLGETVLVAGQGVVGLLVAELMRLSHYGTVITVDRFDTRRRAAFELGCAVISPEDPDAGRRIEELTHGRGVDVAVNVSGSAQALQLALDSLAFGGTVVEASWYGTKETSLRLGRSFHRKRLKIRSSQVSTVEPALSGRWGKPRIRELAVRLLEIVRPSKYITHRFPLDDAQAAFRLLDEHPEETIQVVLLP